MVNKVLGSRIDRFSTEKNRTKVEEKLYPLSRKELSLKRHLCLVAQAGGTISQEYVLG